MSEPAGRHYGTPGAFRRALTDRLRTMAGEGRWTLPQLQRQVANDRLLQRLYLADDGWVVKGAAALMARDLGARATIDIDLYRLAVRQDVEVDLRAAAARDLGDWFRFEIGAARPMEGGVRLPAKAFVGATLWTQFQVDVVADGVRMTSTPDQVPPLARLVMPDLLQENGYRAYPLVDHVADKVVATFQRYGDQQLASTRFKDLIDLVTIGRGASVDADPQRAALVSEALREATDVDTADVLAHLGNQALHLGDDEAHRRCFTRMLTGARDAAAVMLPWSGRSPSSSGRACRTRTSRPSAGCPTALSPST